MVGLSEIRLQEDRKNSLHTRCSLLRHNDLPSELDSQHQESVLELLIQLPMQVVMTCINLNDIKKSINKTAKVFHVKQGLVQEVLQ